MTANEIRKAFLDFFASKGHKVVPSAPIVIKNDPTLMFTNAGMNQFKDYFLGNKLASEKRVADTQKCLRASGKHNDLEDVGKDTYHHTMFEMLGNWSFGDYFKEEALGWAWELLTEVYKLDKSRLYVTVFEGDADVPVDQEAIDIWKKYVPEDRIILANKKDNFWEMGDQGPCGPCSEIHIDLRDDSEIAKISGRDMVNKDHPQVIEIWNNVFIQFNRKADGSLENLPAKHVDTGMGLERLAVVIQGKKSNYDTDVFSYLINYVENKFGVKYGTNEQTDIAIRVLVDHVRAITFTIADGQLPSNTGAGYVIRRILRRAVRYAFRYFNCNEPFLFEMSGLLADNFKDVFPEVFAQKDFLAKVIKEEENSFLRTLSTGTKRFEGFITEAKSKEIPGDFAFELFDTYGFPIDLTQLMAEEEGFGVDLKGYKKALAEQRKRSKADADREQGDWTVVNEGLDVEFVGYDTLESATKILRYRSITAKGKTQYQLVLNKTPFYPEGGGQIGDTGELSNNAEKVYVIDTKKENDLILHFTKELPKSLTADFTAKVNETKRGSTEKNHSVTHLIHSALRKVLGDHVAQKGSLVGPDYMRFDFSHFSKMTNEEIVEVERIVNDKIRENVALGEARNIPIEEAQKAGAMMLFGEKYGESVRMITFDPEYSIELCGGTHVNATGEIGLCRITSEGAVAAGVRRIEVITGKAAEEKAREEAKIVADIKEMLKAKDPMKSVQQLVDDKKKLEDQIEQFKNARATAMRNDLMRSVEEVNGVGVLVKQVELNDAGEGKNLSFMIKNNAPQAAVVLAAAFGDKLNVWVIIEPSLVEQKGLDAKELIKVMSADIRGGGGGQPFFASAGGKNPAGIPAALEKVKAVILEKLA
ncbi:MAG: alanine--tRNA ligase [Bacteroidia bacterium]